MLISKTTIKGNVMKRIKQFVTWMLMALVLFVFLGCQVLKDTASTLTGFKEANPTANVIPVDEDADGTVDVFMVDADRDGVIDLDDQGNPVEVPKTRALIKQAELTDSNIAMTAENLGMLLAGLGIPGGMLLTILGKKWGKIKPTRIAVDLVETVQSYRTTSIDQTDRDVMNKHLDEQDDETKDFVKAVKKGKI